MDMRVFLALHGGLRPSLYTFFSRGCNGLLQNIVFPNPLRDLLLSGLIASLMSRVATRPGQLPTEAQKRSGEAWAALQKNADYRDGSFFVNEDEEEGDDEEPDEEEENDGEFEMEGAFRSSDKSHTRFSFLGSRGATGRGKAAAFGVEVFAHLCGAHASVHRFHSSFSLVVDTRASPPCLRLTCLAFNPSVTAREAAGLTRGRTKLGARTMLHKLLPEFEASRAVAVVIPLASITDLWLHNSPDGDGVGLVTVALSSPPSFERKRMNVSDPSSCGWRPTGDPTPGDAATRSRLHAFVLGAHSAGALVGCLLSVPHRPAMRSRLRLDAAPPPHGSLSFNTAAVDAARAAVAAARGEPVAFDPSAQRSILDALVAARLLTPSAADAAEAADVDARDGARCVVNNRLGGLASGGGDESGGDGGGARFNPCFFDFLNFSARGSDDVSAALASPLPLGACPWIEDYAPARPGGKPLDEATVGDALAENLQNGAWFVCFCACCGGGGGGGGSPTALQAALFSHCPRCHSCARHEPCVEHCAACDACAYQDEHLGCTACGDESNSMFGGGGLRFGARVL